MLNKEMSISQLSIVKGGAVLSASTGTSDAMKPVGSGNWKFRPIPLPTPIKPPAVSI